MSKIITILIFIPLLVLIGMTGSQNFISFFDSSHKSFTDLSNREKQSINTSLLSLSTNLFSDRQTLEVTLRNDGRTTLADFDEWDVIIQYYDTSNNYLVKWLPYVEGAPGDNQWTVKGIYINAENATSEILESGILNTGEEIIIQVKLSPAVHLTANNVAIVSTPSGFTTWNHFKFQGLYLQNSPTPPTGDTNAQTALPLSTTDPTATTLYNYDLDYDAFPGRYIQKGASGVDEEDLTLYQNWRINNWLIDNLEFDTLKGKEPGIIRVSGDVYAIAYQGDGNDGFIKTINISYTGTITDTVIDTLEFDTTEAVAPDIIHIGGNIYAIAYQGDGDDGFLKTVEISSDGIIMDTVIDTLEFDIVSGWDPDIIHINGDIYAVAYRGKSDDGFLKTVEIATDGTITDTVIDTLEFNTKQGIAPNIINISGGIYAIAYQGAGDDGFLATVEISAGGMITDAVIDTLEFDTGQGTSPNIINVSEDIYAIAYRGAGNDGYLITVGVATDGTITDTVIDTLEFDTDKGVNPAIINVNGNIYAIAYQGDGDDGFLKTVEIATDGTITNTIIDTLEFDTIQGMIPVITRVSGDIFTIAYQGDGDNGFLKTVRIASDGTIGNPLELYGDVNLVIWSGMKDFDLTKMGVVNAYLRDFDGTDYIELASATIGEEEWQNGSSTWVEKTITFHDVGYTVPGTSYLELKVTVDVTADDDMWFAYDTTDYPSRLELPD